MDREVFHTLKNAVESGLLNDVRELLIQGVDVNARPDPCPFICGAIANAVTQL